MPPRGHVDRLKRSLPTCPQGSTTISDSGCRVPHETTKGPRWPGIEIVACADLAACFDLVNAGKADAAMADVVSAALLLAETPRSSIQMSGAVPGLRQEHSIALSSRRADLAPLLQKALEASVVEALPELKRRWFSRPDPRVVQRRVLFGALPWLAGALALLLAAWAWHSRALRGEVRRTQSAERRAQRALESSERFVPFLAHEVRNSLHSVIAGTELLRSARQITPAITASLGDSARSTLSLLNNLLDRDRLEAGRLSLQLEPARLEPLLKSVAVEMLPAALAKHLVLHSSPLPHDPLLRLDALRVQQVVRNLVSNAIKYSREGEIRIDARLLPLSPVAGQPRRLQVEVTVHDQGPGIPAAEVAQLFERYRTGTEGASHESASGLGLPLSRELARLMDGELAIESEPGRGTTARLSWPAQIEAEAVVDTTPRPARRFLIVEDGEVYAMLLKRALAMQGLPVTTANSVARACALLATEDFDVVVTDLNLDDGDAHAVIAAARARGTGRQPAIVVMSTEFDERQHAALLEAGVDAVLKKSADVGLFVRRLLLQPLTRAA